MNFTELVTNPDVLRAIEQIGYENATEIQEKAIPLIKTGADVIGKSQTGTGKTMAFSIPMVEMIDTTESKRTAQALILCPTRELAMQVAEEIKKVTQFAEGIKTAVVYGGSPMDRQILNLKRANVVIGTPGRVMDHLRRKTLKLTNLKMIILDEADEMLSMGFKEDIQTILQDAPEERQTILFSATMPPAIMQITKEFQREPVTIEVARKQTVAKITQKYVDVPMGRKMDVLKLFLHMYSNDLAMIFCNTKKMVDEIEENLNKSGFKALGLHGDMKQEQRTKVMNAYKGGSAKILVATDVAARGIDVDDINYVINYDIPQNSEYYVHRIGRTGRAGKTGTAITILSGRRQQFELRDMQRDLKITIDQTAIPNFEDIKQENTNKNIETVAEVINGEVAETYTKMVEALMEKEFTAEQIAAAALQIHFQKLDSALHTIEQIKHRTHANNDDFQKLKIDIGRNKRVAPNHLVGAITERTGITSKNIGKIEIFDGFSIVSVLKADVDKVLESMVGCTICGHETKTVIDTKKDFGRSGGGRRDGGRRDFAKRDNGGRRDFGRSGSGRRDDRRDHKKRYDDTAKKVTPQKFND
ncbi:MAG: DEAD/DEAH box helicase [Clostridia bacterium]